MASAVGSATIDFGAFPGSNEASVAVTGQTSIATGAKCEAFFMADDTSADYTATDHKYAPTFISLTCGDVSDGVGFTIYGRSHEKMQGEWTVNWVWSV